MRHEGFGRTPPPRLIGDARIFKGLDEAALADVAASAHLVRRARATTFFTQGEEAELLFVLRSGRARLGQTTAEGHHIVVRYVGAGGMFGCVPLYGGREYPATATAVTDCEAWSWDRTSAGALMRRHPRVAINALELLGEELAELRKRYRELATERVERRVARALVRLAGQAGRAVDGGVQIGFPLTRQDLAELTGTTLHTVSRVLSAWEERGLVESGRRRIVVRRLHELVAIAEDLGVPPRTRRVATGRRRRP